VRVFAVAVPQLRILETELGNEVSPVVTQIAGSTRHRHLRDGGRRSAEGSATLPGRGRTRKPRRDGDQDLVPAVAGERAASCAVEPRQLSVGAG
jgi:hypothetical protein